MVLPNSIRNLLHDPPPDHVIELSDGGIAYARPRSGVVMFQPLQPGILAVSPLADNVLQPDLLADKLRTLSGTASGKRSPAVLILPDFSARVAVLSFDSFPSDPRDQLALVRFRMKKSVPFDVESAAISYHAQPVKGASKSIHVVVVAAALEIIGRYESVFRTAGLHAGLITTSLIAMAELCGPTGVSIVARLNGKALTVAVLDSGLPKLVRSVELQEASTDEILAVLFPTVAFTEDEIGSRPERLLLCGFGHDLRFWTDQLGVPVEQLQSRFGAPSAQNAGLLGYLQSVSAPVAEVEGAKVA